MKKKKKSIEAVFYGIFLICGLITIAAVLLITVYLIISGIPAIRKIGLVDFCPVKHGIRPARNRIRNTSLYPDERVRHSRGDSDRSADRFLHSGLSF